MARAGTSFGTPEKQKRQVSELKKHLVLALTMGAIFAPSLAGCGGGSGDEQPTTDGQARMQTIADTRPWWLR